jgi:hypothetical protein
MRTRLMQLARSIVCVAVVASLPVNVHAERSERARQLYDEGEAAYQKGEFQSAYDKFKEAYLIAKQPAFLYDMASSLEGLSRPHDAAEALRAYLRARPDAPTRAAVERRIRGLEEAQRILDADLIKRTPPVLEAPPPAPKPWPRKRLALTIGGVVLGAVIAATAIGVGISFDSPGYPSSTLGTHRATP